MSGSGKVGVELHAAIVSMAQKASIMCPPIPDQAEMLFINVFLAMATYASGPCRQLSSESNPNIDYLSLGIIRKVGWAMNLDAPRFVLQKFLN